MHHSNFSFIIRHMWSDPVVRYSYLNSHYEYQTLCHIFGRILGITCQGFPGNSSKSIKKTIGICVHVFKWVWDLRIVWCWVREEAVLGCSTFEQCLLALSLCSYPKLMDSIQHHLSHWLLTKLANFFIDDN